MNAVILPDGNVNLPLELREELELTPGTILEIQSEEGKIVARKKPEQGKREDKGIPFTFSLPGGLVTARDVHSLSEDEDE